MPIGEFEPVTLVNDAANSGHHLRAGVPLCGSCGSWETAPSVPGWKAPVTLSDGTAIGDLICCGVCGCTHLDIPGA